MNINPQKLEGNWREGFSLDFHTIHSTPINDELGNLVGWDTERTQIGAELYRLKYWRESERLSIITQVASDFLKTVLGSWKIDAIIPAPPSDSSRHIQPVFELAKEIGKQLKINVDFTNLKKIKQTSQIKNENDPDKRKEALKDAFSVTENCYLGKNILVFDDLFRSGGTLNAISKALILEGKAQDVYVFTITKTRTNR